MYQSTTTPASVRVVINQTNQTTFIYNHSYAECCASNERIVPVDGHRRHHHDDQRYLQSPIHYHRSSTPSSSPSLSSPSIKKEIVFVEEDLVCMKEGSGKKLKEGLLHNPHSRKNTNLERYTRHFKLM
ncbi:hypothetical protein AKO1_002873 [Acrasis kona]|uniref:Uncharacterized protein n=1 Tax=Acrasis kona TaxID=1008807 RepID=A0AAW2YH23_9EUKA